MPKRFYAGIRQKVKIELGSRLNSTEGGKGAAEFLKTTELIQLQEAALISGFSISYLRNIAQQGRLWAIKKGRSWYTTLAAVEEYKQNRYFIKKVFS